MLLMGFAALFGFLNSNKVKTLRTELGVITVARDAALRQTAAKETTLKNGSSDNAKLSAEARAATAEADLARSRTEKTDLEAKLNASQTQITALQKRVTEATTGAGSSGGDLKAQLEDAKKQLDAAEQEKSLLTDKMKSAGKRAAPPKEEKRRRTPGSDKPGIHGSVLAVNQAYNFVVLSLGERKGVVANSEMLVRRRGTPIGKIHISSVEPTTAIGDIMTNTLARGVQVQPGDMVIYADTTSP